MGYVFDSQRYPCVRVLGLCVDINIHYLDRTQEDEDPVSMDSPKSDFRAGLVQDILHLIMRWTKNKIPLGFSNISLCNVYLMRLLSIK